MCDLYDPSNVRGEGVEPREAPEKQGIGHQQRLGAWERQVPWSDDSTRSEGLVVHYSVLGVPEHVESSLTWLVFQLLAYSVDLGCSEKTRNEYKVCSLVFFVNQ